MRLFLIIALLGFVLSLPAQDAYTEGKKAQTEKKYDVAIQHFKKASTQNPEDGKAWYELGWCYNETGKYADASVALNSAKMYMKEQPKVYFESGYAYDFIGKTEDAIADYKKCLEIDPGYSSAYRQIGNIYFDADKDYKNALSYYNQYIDKAEAVDISSKTWYKKGYSEIEFKQYEDAIFSLKKATALDDTYAAAFDELGFAYYKLSKADEAIEAYEGSILANATSSTPYSGLGDVYRFLKKNHDKAFDNYKKGVDLNSKSANCNFGLGWSYNENSEFDTAIPYLKAAIALNDKFASYHTELGYAYYGQKKYEESLVELERSTNIVENGVAYYYMGLCYIATNQKTKALDVHKKLVALQSPDAESFLKKVEAMP